MFWKEYVVLDSIYKLYGCDQCGTSGSKGDSSDWKERDGRASRLLHCSNTMRKQNYQTAFMGYWPFAVASPRLFSGQVAITLFII